jgi:ATP-dependent helicase/nuclease subunit A
MGNAWTQEQLDAMTTTGCNLLVSAAAGAGKTAVLVERIILLLCDRENPIDIDHLLVVTFTEAAAAEMRERIGLALDKEIRQSGRVGLSRQLSLLNGAPISTLHSFCLDVIRRYFYLLDLDPAFRVADEREATMLQQDVLDDLLEEALSDDDPLMLALAARFGGKRGDEGLGRQILRLYRFAWSNPDPGRWLDRAAAVYTPREGVIAQEALCCWLSPLKDHFHLVLGHASSTLLQAQALCRLPGGPLVYEKVLAEEHEQLENLRLALAGSWENLREAWQGAAFARLPTARGVDDEAKKLIQNMRDSAKKAVKDAATAYFSRTEEDYLAEIRELEPLVCGLVQLTGRFGEQYGKKKRQVGLLDFNDLEHYCLQILTEGSAEDLTPSEAAFALRKRFAHVLVDEYQDINPVQDAILTLVSRQGEEVPNLFMVGDVKQSIYRFRLGDPGLFMERYHSYPAESGGSEQRLLLSKNFRCRDGVVSAVNFIFRQLMSQSVAEIEYDLEAELVCGAHYPDSGYAAISADSVEMHLLDRDEDGMGSDVSEGDGADDLDALEREGVVVAQRIREMLQDTDQPLHVFDKETDCYRPASFRDMVILLRATSNRANRLADILSRFGIPAYADLSSGYFAATEVETMLALLQVVDNPCQDIPLAAVLRSPFVGLTIEEMAIIRITGGKQTDYYDAVLLTATAEIPGLSEKIVHFLEQLERWRSLARREKLAAFISEIYRESGYADYVAGLPDGLQRQANLRALFSRARQFDRFSRQGLFRYLEFIHQLRRSGEDLGAARALGENEDVVRIMSIHKSKGLEFPVVFLCDLGKKFNFKDLQADILIHRNLGLGPLVVWPEDKLRYPSLPYLALKLVGEAETRAEEMRILYVALTRAREKLILVGSTRGLENEVEGWRRLLSHSDRQLPAAEVARARSYLDWLGRALIRHHDLDGNREKYRWLEGEQSHFSLHFGDKKISKLPDDAVTKQAGENILAALLLLQPLPLTVDEQEQQAIRQRLQFRYPHEQSRLPAKMSVSEIKRRFDAEEQGEGEAQLITPPTWSRPSFLRHQEGLTAAERGILYHRVFQHLDFALATDAAGIAKQIQRFIHQGILDAKEAALLDPLLLSRYFQCEAGRITLKDAHRTYREWPFTLMLPAAELANETAQETVVVQGIIDLLIRTDEGYVIVDFKTDRIPPGGPDELVKRYQEQLRYYARAVETILTVPVCAAFIYALQAGTCVPVLMNN